MREVSQTCRLLVAWLDDSDSGNDGSPAQQQQQAPPQPSQQLAVGAPSSDASSRWFVVYTMAEYVCCRELDATRPDYHSVCSLLLPRELAAFALTRGGRT